MPSTEWKPVFTVTSENTKLSETYFNWYNTSTHRERKRFRKVLTEVLVLIHPVLLLKKSLRNQG